jgi:hypothetical protein
VLDLLRAAWREPRPDRPPPPGWRDWALVAALVPLAVLEGALRTDLPWRILSVVVVVALAPTLVWRRTRPLLMVAIAFVTTAVIAVVVGGNFPRSYTVAFLLVLLYALYRWGSGREMVLDSAIVLGKVSLVLGFLAVRRRDVRRHSAWMIRG